MISIFISIFTLSFVLFFLYIKISSKLKIIDIPNNLNVHKNKIPTGAGIIFLLNFYFFLIIYKFYIPLDFFFTAKKFISFYNICNIFMFNIFL